MANEIKLVFDSKFHGVLKGHHGSSRVGPAEGALGAYDMVLGGLASCLNHTFQTVIDKKRLKFDKIIYDIKGIKRNETPTTLKEVNVNITISGANQKDEEQFIKAMRIATEYCSVYQTLTKVATMNWQVKFIKKDD